MCVYKKIVKTTMALEAKLIFSIYLKNFKEIESLTQTQIF